MNVNASEYIKSSYFSSAYSVALKVYKMNLHLVRLEVRFLIFGFHCYYSALYSIFGFRRTKVQKLIVPVRRSQVKRFDRSVDS